MGNKAWRSENLMKTNISAYFAPLRLETSVNLFFKSLILGILGNLAHFRHLNCLWFGFDKNKSAHGRETCNNLPRAMREIF